MPELKIAIALASLRQPFKKALHTAARMGATGVEIDARHGLRPSELSDTGLRQLKKTLSDLNLRLAGVRFPTRHGYDIAQDLDCLSAASPFVRQHDEQIDVGVVS